MPFLYVCMCMCGEGVELSSGGEGEERGGGEQAALEGSIC